MNTIDRRSAKTDPAPAQAGNRTNAAAATDAEPDPARQAPGDGLERALPGLATGLTALDVVGVALAGGMVLMLAARAFRSLRELAVEEPAARRVWSLG